MPGKQSPNRPSTLLGQALKTYLETHKEMTHEKLAELLDVDPKTVSRWKSGETMITDPYELKQIADRLALSYEQLAIPPAIYAPLTSEQVEDAAFQVWTQIFQAHIIDARIIAENTILQLRQHMDGKNPLFLRAVARMYNAAAHATSMNVRTAHVQQAIYHYQQMEQFARLCGNDTLINIALTYQGDMFRRRRDVPQALEYLKAARETTPQADASALGNCLQLLGRACFQAGQERECFNALAQAEDFAHEVEQQSEPSVKMYNVLTVYEEYARCYGRVGKVQRALDYLEKAQQARPLTKVKEMLLNVARAEVLIYAGDVTSGESLAIQAARACRESGHQRQLERLYALKRFMSQQILNYGKVERALSEALDGPIEF